MTDTELARWAAAGDTEAFERLALRYRPRISRVVGVRLRSAEDTDDVTQETIERAFHRIRGLEHPECFGNWLHAIARNICQETLRQRARLVFCGTDYDPLCQTWQEALQAWQCDQGRHVMEALVWVPLEQRAVLVMHCLDGVPLQAVADLLGVSLSAAKMRVLRARTAAREAPTGRPIQAKDVRLGLAQAYYHIARMHLKAGDFERTKDCWRRGLDHRPASSLEIWDAVKAQVYAANVFEWDRLHDGAGMGVSAPSLPDKVLQAAAQVLEWGVSKYPDDPAVWFIAGKMRMSVQGQLEVAEAAFARAAKSAKLRHIALIRMACGQALFGKPERALEHMEQLEREKLWDVEVPLAHAMAFAAAGKTEAAAREARRALAFARSTEYDRYWTAHRHFVPAHVLALCGYKQEARKAYLSALEALPPEPMRTVIGMCLGQLTR